MKYFGEVERVPGNKHPGFWWSSG